MDGKEIGKQIIAAAKEYEGVNQRTRPES